MNRPADPNLFVRDATLEDLADLVHLKDSLALHRDRLSDAHSPTFHYFVLERAGTVIGFACLVFARPLTWSDACDVDHLPQIIDVLISAALRGRGYGSFLISSLEEYAAQRGCAKIFLEVDPVHNPRAYALYKRLGYRQLQTEPYLKHWEFVDSAGDLHTGDDWTLDMVKLL